MQKMVLFPSCRFVFLWCNLVGYSVEIQYDYFHKVEDSNSILHYSTSTSEASSLIHCARKCQQQECACYSYSNHQCSVGKCNATNTTLSSSQEIYVSCLGSDGFTFITIGSVSACVWVSTIMTDYFTARSSCRAKDAYLYTVKTMEKLTWLQTNYYKKILWIGLNDIEEEGTYRWEDDNSICSGSWINATFVPGQPSNGKLYTQDGEDCISFFYEVPLLNDAYCFQNFSYICEKPFFNFP